MARWLVMVVMVTGGAWTLLACDEPGTVNALGCMPGTVQNCPCLGGGEGVQSCDKTGAAWEACQCLPIGDAYTAPETTAPDVTPGETTGPDCTPQATVACLDGHPTYFDSCGEPGPVAETCAMDAYCDGGECITACLPHAQTYCVGDDIFWYDSCGTQESLLQGCGDDEFCKGCQPGDDPCGDTPTCVKGFFSGEWLVTADPDTKDACGFGSTTFFDQTLTLVIDGTQATASVDILNFHVDYTGALDGKKLTLSGSYVQEQEALGMTTFIYHDEAYDVTFSSLTEFSGVLHDHFEVDSIVPLACDLYWQVTGVKQ